MQNEIASVVEGHCWIVALLYIFSEFLLANSLFFPWVPYFKCLVKKLFNCAICTCCLICKLGYHKVPSMIKLWSAAKVKDEPYNLNKSKQAGKIKAWFQFAQRLHDNVMILLYTDVLKINIWHFFEGQKIYLIG